MLFDYVSDIPDGSDEVFSEFSAEGRNMGLERNGVETERFFGFAPNGFEDFGLVLRYSAIFGEEFEHSPFFRRQIVTSSVF